MRKSAGSPVLNLKTSNSGGIQYGKQQGNNLVWYLTVLNCPRCGCTPGQNDVITLDQHYGTNGWES